MTIFLILCIILFLFVFHRAGYDIKLLEKVGILEQQHEIDWTANGWERSLNKMHIDADIVFFGDSITAGSDFQESFPNYTIVELGIPGDTIIGMTSRVGMLKALSPEKIFVMGGINSLTDYNSDKVLAQYKVLIMLLKDTIPDAEIYIQSILPVSNEKEYICHNKSIRQFNTDLEIICGELQVMYIDLFSLYAKDGNLNPDYTSDGIHLKPEAYIIWIENIAEYIE